jgi:small-conductance mechanosensitive channel
VLVQPEPQAFFVGFGENSMNFRLQAWSSQDEFVRLRSELHVHVHRALSEAGVPVPYAVKVLPAPPATTLKR